MASTAQLQALINTDNATVETVVKAWAALRDPRLKGTNFTYSDWSLKLRKLEQQVLERQVRVHTAAAQARVALFAIPGYALYDGLTQAFGFSGVRRQRQTGLGIAPIVLGVLVLAGAVAGAVAAYFYLKPDDIPNSERARAEAQSLFDKVLAAAIAGGQITPAEGAELREEMSRRLKKIEEEAYRAGQDSGWGVKDWLKVLGIGAGAYFVGRMLRRPSSPA